jgi:DnaJ-class molecular chaperone
MNKYDCIFCDGKGSYPVKSIEGIRHETCTACNGYGKQMITIFVEEYKELKEKASMYDRLCE